MVVDLSEFSIMEIIGLAEKSGKFFTAIRSEDPHMFLVYTDGKVIYASYRKLLGDKAFISSLLLRKGNVEVFHLPRGIRIKTNIVGRYEELMKEAADQRLEYEMIMSEIGSLDTVPVLNLELQVEEVCVNWLQWALIVAAVKRMTINEVVDSLAVSEYDMAKATLELVRAGAISLSEENRPSMPANSSNNEPPIRTATQKSSRISESGMTGKKLIGQVTRPPEIHTERRIEYNNLGEGLVQKEDSTTTSSKQQVNLNSEKKESLIGIDREDGFELNVTVLPFGASVTSSDSFDDSSVAINTEIYKDMVRKFGEEFSRAYLLNPERKDIEPIIVNLLPTPHIPSAALTIGSFLRLGAKNGQKVKLVPIKVESGSGGSNAV